MLTEDVHLGRGYRVAKLDVSVVGPEPRDACRAMLADDLRSLETSEFVYLTPSRAGVGKASWWSPWRRSRRQEALRAKEALVMPRDAVSRTPPVSPLRPPRRSFRLRRSSLSTMRPGRKLGIARGLDRTFLSSGAHELHVFVVESAHPACGTPLHLADVPGSLPAPPRYLRPVRAVERASYQLVAAVHVLPFLDHEVDPAADA